MNACDVAHLLIKIITKDRNRPSGSESLTTSIVSMFITHLWLDEVAWKWLNQDFGVRLQWEVSLFGDLDPF